MKRMQECEEHGDRVRYWLALVLYHDLYEWILSFVCLLNAVFIGLEVDFDSPWYEIDNGFIPLFLLGHRDDRTRGGGEGGNHGSEVSAPERDKGKITKRDEEEDRKLARVNYDLELLTWGIFHAFKALLWVGFLFSVSIYTISVLVTILYENDRGDPLIDEFFGSVRKSMLTMFQIITLESWTNGIVRPAETVSPGKTYLFIFWVCFATFGLLNVLTAIFVEHTIVTAQADEQARKTQILQERKREAQMILSLMEEADENKDGNLSKAELLNMLENPDFVMKLLNLEISPEDAEALFSLLDVTGRGFVLRNEWMEGCLRLKGSAQAMDVVRVEKMQQKLERQVRISLKTQQAVFKHIRKLGDGIERIPEKLGLPKEPDGMGLQTAGVSASATDGPHQVEGDSDLGTDEILKDVEGILEGMDTPLKEE
uniref:EF-hand domain-containing protein n=1 Tax=Chromera velia CCMP2878 TaxID=1169474 RepID=A0A0G4FGS1_9ALVE|eukprot:Cvel_16951.t1-p1 / transcript=Cvel_16951.t1 / gene=Cvel_16951 / organism=Chromera_velia_CCMP2878 / gene_product=hypothetical protein / transcript_product=hypothetical protein / location=Cvel_scaffold1329:44872-48453(+) / protein_length=426 / sequence_SO=supercontig / SO=protein_coding / is_pseudo=false